MTNEEVWKLIEARIFEDENLRMGTSPGESLIAHYSVLVEQSKVEGGWTTISRFLRFITATVAMQHFIFTRELTAVHAWIVRGLNDEYQGGQIEQVCTIRPFEFAEDAIISASPYFESVMHRWLGALYYYCAEQSALDEFGKEYFKFAVRLCLGCTAQDFDDAAAFLLGRLVTWSVQTGMPQAADLTRLCEMFVERTEIPNRSRALLALTMQSRSGRLSKHDRSYWTAYALKHFGDDLPNQDLLPLLVSSWDGSSGELSERIVSIVHGLRIDTIQSDMSKLEQRAVEDFKVELIKPLLGTAIQAGNFAVLHAATAAWYGIELDRAVLAGGILWQVPLHENGYMGLIEESSLMLPRPSNEHHATLVDSSNRFIGSSVTVRGAPSSQLHVPERMGVPSSDCGNAFEAALRSTYLPSEAEIWLADQARNISAQIALPNSAHPVQAVQMKFLKTTWPLASSFETPLPDANLSKVAIWSSGGLLAPQFEFDVLSAIFQSRGIVVDVFTAGDEHGKCFADIYEDTTYQIIWLISHGEYDHFAPKEAKLETGPNGATTGLDELLNSGIGLTARRLLVLNVCDGATHPGNGVLPRLGFAASLATPWQATISHKWPVNPIPAAVFGALLADRLARGDSFFDAYKRAVAATIHNLNTNEIAATIDSAAGEQTELSDRIRQSSIVFSAFEHYASAAFFE